MSRLTGRESREQILNRYDIRSLVEIEAQQQSIPPRPEYVKDSELLALLNSHVGDDGVVETARRLYWRHLNDSFREVYRAFRDEHIGEVDAKGDSATFPEYLPSAEQTVNTEQLVKLLGTPVKPNWLELAELYRGLGEMDAAARALSHLRAHAAIFFWH